MSGRTLLLSFEVFCFLATSYYSASIVKYLLRPPPNRIRTMLDFLHSPYSGGADTWLPNQRELEVGLAGPGLPSISSLGK